MTSDLVLEGLRLLDIRAADGGAVLCFEVEYFNGRELKRRALCAFSARLSRVPTVGALDAEVFEMLCREDEIRRCMNAGMRALSAGEHSALRLLHKLRTHGFSREIAEEVLAQLKLRGYIDEERGALQECEKLLKKLYGERRILSELRAKGYGEEGLAAVRERLAGENGAARCRALLLKKHITVPEEPKALSKLIAALVRYGYTGGEIRAALQVDVEDLE